MTTMSLSSLDVHLLVESSERNSPELCSNGHGQLVLEKVPLSGGVSFSSDVTSCVLMNQCCWIALMFSWNVLYEVLSSQSLSALMMSTHLRPLSTNYVQGRMVCTYVVVMKNYPTV